MTNDEIENENQHFCVICLEEMTEKPHRRFTDQECKCCFYIHRKCEMDYIIFHGHKCPLCRHIHSNRNYYETSFINIENMNQRQRQMRRRARAFRNEYGLEEVIIETDNETMARFIVLRERSIYNLALWFVSIFIISFNTPFFLTKYLINHYRNLQITQGEINYAEENRANVAFSFISLALSSLYIIFSGHILYISPRDIFITRLAWELIIFLCFTFQFSEMAIILTTSINLIYINHLCFIRRRYFNIVNNRLNRNNRVEIEVIDEEENENNVL